MPLLRGPMLVVARRHDLMKDREIEIATNDQNECKRRDRGHRW
jgi:hypothetical protein